MMSSSCGDKPEDRLLCFIGDSQVERWDLPAYFPSRRVENFGYCGSGIDYLESYAGEFRGKDVVVLSGTNNTNFFNENDREAFVDRYVDAILALEARKIYLYSILPRDFKNDYRGVNDYILAFNRIVKEKVREYPSIVYLDVYDKFMCGGKINPQLYTDRLHLTIYGYEILTRSLIKAL